MKATLKSLFFCATTFLTSVAQAEESPHYWGGTVWATTDYMFRGLTNSDNKPAIQGELDYGYEPLGLYAFVWASSLDLPGVDTDVELNYGLGVSDTFTDHAGWDIGAIYYHYPGSDVEPEVDYWEVYGELNYAFEGIALEPYINFIFWYSPEFFGEDSDAVYIETNIELSLPEQFTLVGHAGFQGVEGDKLSGTVGYEYFDFALSLRRQFYGVDFDLSYTNTINQKDACGSISDCDHHVVFTASKAFEF